MCRKELILTEGKHEMGGERGQPGMDCVNRLDQLEFLVVGCLTLVFGCGVDLQKMVKADNGAEIDERREQIYREKPQ